MLVLVLASNKCHCSVLGSCRNSSAKIPLSHGYLLCLHFAFLVHPAAPPLSSRERSLSWAAERGGSLGRAGWGGGSKTGWCSERWDYINSGVNEKPKPSMWPALGSEQPLPVPAFGDTNETTGEPQRRGADLGNSKDPAERPVWGRPSVEQSVV